MLLKKPMCGNIDTESKLLKLMSKHIVETMDMKKYQADPCFLCMLDEKCKIILFMSATIDEYSLKGLEININ